MSLHEDDVPLLWSIRFSAEVILSESYELKMFTVCKTTCIFWISLWGHRTCAAEDRTELDEPASPMFVVEGVEQSALSRDIRPTALLFLDLGSILIEGSFTSDASLLSLRPHETSRAVVVHFGLWQALAASLRIIVFLSQAESLKRKMFFSSDFVQNIRHKLMYVLFTRTAAQHRSSPNDLGIFFLPTFVVIGRQSIRSLCYENRDNLFYERVLKPMRDCALAVTRCKILYSDESYSALIGMRALYDSIAPSGSS